MKGMLLKRILLGTLVAGLWLPAITCDISGLDRWWDGYYYPGAYHYEETYYYDDYYWGDPYDYGYSGGSGWGLDFWLGGWW